MAARIVRSALVIVATVAVVAACGSGRSHYNPDMLTSGGSTLASPEVPQECGDGASFGSIGVGTLVVLHPHRPVDGDRNFIAGMSRYVGRVTRVTDRAGRDPSGCPVVRVSIDGGRHFWRVRDLGMPGRGLGPGGGDAVPQHCDQDDDTADYGLVGPGSTVVLWRHRPIEGDTNWVNDMAEHIGQETRVTRLAGVDGPGCPVVSVAVDNGEFVWRVRDLTLVASGLPQTCERGARRPAPPPEEEEGTEEGEEEDEEEEEARVHGPLAVGSSVRLGRHRPVRGDANWQHSMERYVGRVARVTSLGPPDDQGCPVVHVDADQGARPWRVRDLALLDEVRDGRVATTGIGPGPRPPGSTGGIPQECGMPFGGETYGPIREGTRIVLGRHRPVDGDDNWAEEMAEYVGRSATVTRLSGSDASGCPGVRVDIDGGEWFWRIRDTTLAP